MCLRTAEQDACFAERVVGRARLLEQRVESVECFNPFSRHRASCLEGRRRQALDVHSSAIRRDVVRLLQPGDRRAKLAQRELLLPGDEAAGRFAAEIADRRRTGGAPPRKGRCSASAKLLEDEDLSERGSTIR
jgi:hypothetical protein